ncbi:hypothetical protein Halha_1960 [Halobacteroides halobius DSM 5150]|uniref:Uncharacterized protein n=1 Tax=Halobacteroides halobius (strain ATCC 35273 / DSM 5150 / MD-1) TaxID=748449 RepID=L0KBX6_HALHC|nr:hypothetical protein [Halobacteroides halobius]AGB41864.1 hypothetical protein Halha_1960 [Halobacteroides halobius DSM 5150]
MEALSNVEMNELNEEELTIVNGGGWDEFGQALGGTLEIAAAPIVFTAGSMTGQSYEAAKASKAMVKDGWKLIETASENAY